MPRSLVHLATDWPSVGRPLGLANEEQPWVSSTIEDRTDVAPPK